MRHPGNAGAARQRGTPATFKAKEYAISAQLFDRAFELPTRGTGERAVILAAMRWTNDDGVLWPSAARWAKAAGVDGSTFGRIVRRLIDRGILKRVEPSRGGAGRTSRYQIPALAKSNNPRTTREIKPTHHAAGTPAPCTKTPAPCGRNINKNNSENNNNVVVDPVERVLEEFKNHPGLAPERAEWIRREAPSKANPAGWTADCIRNGWNPPHPSKSDKRKVQREAAWARFNEMDPAERRAIETEARARFPNLANESKHLIESPAMQGAIAQVMGDE